MAKAANSMLGSSAFKRRFFVLRDSVLEYYRDETMKTQSGRIDLNTGACAAAATAVALANNARLPSLALFAVMAVEASEPGKAGVPPFGMELTTDARVYIVAPESEPLQKEWLDRLQSVILTNARRGMLARSLRGEVLRRAAANKGSWNSSNVSVRSGILDSLHSPDSSRSEARLEGHVRRAMLAEASAAQGGKQKPGSISAAQDLMGQSLESTRRTLLGQPVPALAPHYDVSDAATAELLGDLAVAAGDETGGVPLVAKKGKKPKKASGRRAAAEAGMDEDPFQRSVRRASLVHALPSQASLPRRRRPLTRWEHISGNVPRWELSLLSDARLRHVPAFTPYSSLPSSAQHSMLGAFVGNEYAPGFGTAAKGIKRMDGTDGGFGGDSWVEDLLLQRGMYAGVGLSSGKEGVTSLDTTALHGDDDDEEEDEAASAASRGAGRRRAALLPGAAAAATAGARKVGGPPPPPSVPPPPPTSTEKAGGGRGSVASSPPSGAAADEASRKDSSAGDAASAAEEEAAEERVQDAVAKLAAELPLLYVAQHTLEQVAKHSSTAPMYDDTGLLRGSSSELDRMVAMTAEERTHWTSMMMQWRQLYHRGSGIQTHAQRLRGGDGTPRRRSSSGSVSLGEAAAGAGQAEGGEPKPVGSEAQGTFIVPPPRLMDLSLPSMWDRLKVAPANVVHGADAALSAMPNAAGTVPSAGGRSRPSARPGLPDEPRGWIGRNRGLTHSLSSLDAPLPEQADFNLGRVRGVPSAAKQVALAAVAPLVPALPQEVQSDVAYDMDIQPPGVSEHFFRTPHSASVPHSLLSTPHIHVDPLAPSSLPFPRLQAEGTAHVPAALGLSVKNSARASATAGRRASSQSLVGAGSGGRGGGGAGAPGRPPSLASSASLVAGICSDGSQGAFTTPPLAPSLTQQAFSASGLRHLNFVTRAVRAGALYPDDAAAATDLARRDHSGSVDIMDRLLSMFKLHNVPAGTMIKVAVADMWGMDTPQSPQSKAPSSHKARAQGGKARPTPPPSTASKPGTRGALPSPGGDFPVALLSPQAYAAVEAVGISPNLFPPSAAPSTLHAVGTGLDPAVADDRVFSRSIASAEEGGPFTAPGARRAQAVSAAQRQRAARSMASECVAAVTAAAGVTAHAAVNKATELGGSSIAPAIVMSADSFYILLHGRVRCTSTIVDTTHNVFKVPGQRNRQAGKRVGFEPEGHAPASGRKVGRNAPGLAAGVSARSVFVSSDAPTRSASPSRRPSAAIGLGPGPLLPSQGGGASPMRSPTVSTIGASRLRSDSRITLLSNAAPIKRDASSLATTSTLLAPRSQRGSLRPLRNARSSIVALGPEDARAKARKATLATLMSGKGGGHLKRSTSFAASTSAHATMLRRASVLLGSTVLGPGRSVWPALPWWLGHQQSDVAGAELSSRYEVAPLDSWRTLFPTTDLPPSSLTSVSPDTTETFCALPGAGTASGTWGSFAMQWVDISADAGPVVLGGGGIPGRLRPPARALSTLQALGLREAGDSTASTLRHHSVAAQGVAQAVSAATDDGKSGLFSDVAYHHSPDNVPAGMSRGKESAPHTTIGSEVMASQACFLLELPKSRFPLLSAWYPQAGVALQEMAWWAQRPRAIVGCVPCLAATFTACTPDGFAYVGTAGTALQASIASLVKPVFVPQGGTLFKPGDDGDCAYIVMRGEVALSVTAALSGMSVLLCVKTRGTCLGEEALVLPGPRLTRATALSDTHLLRISHASLRNVLGRYPRAWGMVRDLVMWREASTLVRLPMLATLAGGEGDAERLAPLSDLFQLVVLDASSTPGARDYKEDTQPFSSLRHALDEWVTEFADPVEKAGGEPIDPLEHMREEAELSLPSVIPLRTPLPCLRGEAVQSLMVVAAGAVDISGSAAQLYSGQSTASGGEWLGGSTLLPPSKVEQAWNEGLTLSANASVSLYTPLLVLHKDVIVNFSKTLPSGSRRLVAWTKQVAESMRGPMRDGLENLGRALPRPTTSAAADDRRGSGGEDGGPSGRKRPPPPPTKGGASGPKRVPKAPERMDSKAMSAVREEEEPPNSPPSPGVSNTGVSKRSKRPSLLMYGQGGSSSPIL